MTDEEKKVSVYDAYLYNMSPTEIALYAREAQVELKRLRDAVLWAITEMEDVAPDFFGSVWAYKAQELRRRAGMGEPSLEQARYWEELVSMAKRNNTGDGSPRWVEAVLAADAKFKRLKEEMDTLCLIQRGR